MDSACLPAVTAIGHLARIGLAVVPAELGSRAGALARGELAEGDARRTANDLALVARMLAPGSPVA